MCVVDDEQETQIPEVAVGGNQLPVAELKGPKWARGNSVVHLHGLEPTASNFPTQKY